MRLDGIGTKDLSELIGVVYESALESEQWRRLMTRLVEMFPGHVAVVNTRDGDHIVGFYTPVGSDQVKPPFQDYQTIIGIKYDAKTSADPTHFRQLQKRGKLQVGAVNQSRTMFDDAAFRAFRVYKLFCEPFGLGHWTTLWFSRSGTRSAYLVFVENEADPTPKDSDGLRRTLELLAPHVVRGARIARALYMAKEAAETYKGFLDAIALPLLIVDRQCVLQMANSAGQRLLERGALLQTSLSGNLSLTDAGNDSAFKQMVKGVVAQRDVRGVRVALGDSTVSLCVAPFHPSMMTKIAAEHDVFRKDQLFAVFVGMHGEGAVNTALLQDVFQLTLREAEVCSALVAGHSPAQIADEQGRAEKTVRNQIQAVHEKVGVISARELAEAMSVFRTVGAMFDNGDPHVFGPAGRAGLGRVGAE